MYRTTLTLFALTTLVLCSPSCRRRPTVRQNASMTLRIENGMVLIPGGEFVMGTDRGFKYEGPARKVTLSPYWIDQHEVTESESSKFVDATGRKTDAEKRRCSGVSGTKPGERKTWNRASWRHPDGPGPGPN